MTERDLAALPRARARADPGRLQGPRRVGHGPAVQRRLDRRRGLNILEGYQPLGADRTQALHRFLEASRYSFADRGRYLADPGVLRRAAAVPAVGSVRGAAPRADHRARPRRSPVAPGDCGPGRTSPSRDDEGLSTTHLTVADDDGMVVSYTFTIESTGGNGIVVPGWGFLLNNELTDFDYTSLTARQPGRRRQAPAQLDVADDHHPHGKPFLAVGSPGGSMIITTVSAGPARALELGKTLPEAIAAPRAVAAQHRDDASPSRRSCSRRRCAELAPHGHAFGDIRRRSAPRPGSSSSIAARCSPPRSPSDAAAAARWWSSSASESSRPRSPPAAG